MEVYTRHSDLEQVRVLPGHVAIEEAGRFTRVQTPGVCCTQNLAKLRSRRSSVRAAGRPSWEVAPIQVDAIGAAGAGADVELREALGPRTTGPLAHSLSIVPNGQHHDGLRMRVRAPPRPVTGLLPTAGKVVEIERGVPSRKSAGGSDRRCPAHSE
jgi:hypothetical protein